MAFAIRGILESTIRTEMKQRVDELLKAQQKLLVEQQKMVTALEGYMKASDRLCETLTRVSKELSEAKV